MNQVNWWRKSINEECIHVDWFRELIDWKSIDKEIEFMKKVDWQRKSIDEESWLIFYHGAKQIDTDR